MITSHVLQNPCVSSNAHHCLLLALPAGSLRPRIATFLSSSNGVLRFSRALSSEISARKSSVVGVSGFRSKRGLESRVYGRQGIRVLSSGIFSSRFSVAVRASMEAVASADVKDSKSEEVPKVDPIVQYIVLRKDLVETMKWPLGSVISQGCHAAVAAIWLFKDDPVTAEYCSSENLDHMHKVTLEVKGETQLTNLAKKLEAGGVAHKLWMEQPENYPTCLATKPYRKSEVASVFKSLKLCR
ncbi:hypothetical protein KC19_8G094000 [Ceratodon purpureus]|uniref:peptidyl-tRNA hydrolase n=1 Tax=Ceratodon purpureus TaxID=3225 RepID=A0A8T0GYU3_CERPU|nr:hypothetical protein KC19_8G094000 [Ceratodon purpureus]